MVVAPATLGANRRDDITVFAPRRRPATVRAGGPGSGFVDLEIMGMAFAGTVVHGGVRISP